MTRGLQRWHILQQFHQSSSRQILWKLISKAEPVTNYRLGKMALSAVHLLVPLRFSRIARSPKITIYKKNILWNNMDLNDMFCLRNSSQRERTQNLVESSIQHWNSHDDTVSISGHCRLDSERLFQNLESRNWLRSKAWRVSVQDDTFFCV